MQIAGEYTFDAPQQLVWKALRDPEVLGTIMPGGEGFAEVGENEFAGNLNVKVGPVQGKFQGNIRLSDIVEPESYRIDVDGKGPQGFVKANGRLHLTPQGEQTHMAYDGDAQVGGRIASVGQRLLDSSAKSIIRQSLEGLNQYLKLQVAADSPPTTVSTTASPAADEVDEVTLVDAPPIEAIPDEPLESTPVTMPVTETTPPASAVQYTPPSQTSVALNVAKDVAGDLIPPQYRPIVTGIIVLLLLALIVLIYLALT
jgi:carbon monoxide dehydrogenase subunit G